MFDRLISRIDAFFTGATGHEEGQTTRADFNTQLSIERTLLAHERTLMAWVRTATSLISFGFTIYKFFQLETKGQLRTSQIIGPRTFAAMMIVMGLFALAIATIQHREHLRRQRNYGVPPSTLAGWVAALISVLGITALAAVFLGI
jgi:putative membrane protein